MGIFIISPDTNPSLKATCQTYYSRDVKEIDNTPYKILFDNEKKAKSVVKKYELCQRQVPEKKDGLAPYLLMEDNNLIYKISLMPDLDSEPFVRGDSDIDTLVQMIQTLTF